MPEKWWLNALTLPGGLILGGPGETFTEGQQEKFGVDAAGNVQDEAKFAGAVKRICAVRASVTTVKLKINSIYNLREDQWLPEPHAIIHIKGFGSGLNPNIDKAVLKDISRSKGEMIVWDGDGLEETGFTKMVPQFLETTPQSKALAFVLDYEVDDFKESWEKVIEQFPGRIRVVAVDLKSPTWRDAADQGITEELKSLENFPEWAQEYFLMGRLACKITGSQKVFSLGGGGISAHEAKASGSAGVKWTVYALSRGRDEAYPTLADWAAENQGPDVKLRRNLDPDEAKAFSKDENKKKKNRLLEAFLGLVTCCSR